MSIFGNLLKGILGNKSDRDIKEVMPVIAQIKEEYSRITGFTNDQLRAETVRIKLMVSDYIKAEEDEIALLKERAESGEMPIEEGEKLYNRVDKLEEIVTAKIEEILKIILPTAFSIVKDTARRFFENSEIVVSVSDFDRELAARKDFVTIEGEKAIFKNSWVAGGTLQTWNMVHYDVQLIVVLQNCG